MGSGLPISDFWVSGNSKKIGLRQVNQNLSSFFFPKYVGILADFSKFCSAFPACSILKNHQIWQKVGKKMKKSLVQLALNPFLHASQRQLLRQRIVFFSVYAIVYENIPTLNFIYIREVQGRSERYFQNPKPRFRVKDPSLKNST